MSTTRFCTDYAKRVAKCQKCKMQLEKGILRLGKIVPNFFLQQKDDSKPPPDMKQYFHKNCLFEMLFKARATTKVIDSIDEIEGFDSLNAEDKEEISKLVDELTEKRSKDDDSEKKTPKKTPAKKKETEPELSKKRKIDKNEDEAPKKAKQEVDESSSSNLFYKFVKTCEILRKLDDPSEKSETINSLINKKGFDGELILWLKLFIREQDNRKYGVTENDLATFFEKILKLEEKIKLEGDITENINEIMTKLLKNEKSDWSIQKIERFLEKLANLKDNDERCSHFKFAIKRLSPLEMQYLIRLILKNLNINLSTKEVLKGVHHNAFKEFEKNKSLEDLVEKYQNGKLDNTPKEKKDIKKNSKNNKKTRSDRDDSENERSDSEESFISDSEESEDDEISETDSSDVSDISSSENDEEEEEGNDDRDKENVKIKLPRGTRSRPINNGKNQSEKEKCPENMEKCWYGEKCYRKNKEHLEQYWHPEKNA